MPPRVGIATGEVVRLIAGASKVRMACESRLREIPVAVLVKGDIAAPELMHAVALATSARWVKLGNGCALCRMPELADLSTRPDEELEAMRVANVREMLESLTPDQRRRVEAGGVVPFAEFTPRQKEIARSDIALSLIEAPHDYRPEGINGQGVFLKLTRTPNEAHTTLNLMTPGYFLDPWMAMCPDYPGGA